MKRTHRLWSLVLAAALAAPAAVAAQDAATEATQRRPRQSWTSDRREFRVGDVVTVVVDEYTHASADKRDVNNDRRFRDAVLSAGAGGIAGASVGADFVTSNEADSRRRGEATRQNRFQGEITARVTSIENGLLQIEGSKLINVDDHKEEMHLTGWVRPEDVAATNLVESWRVGNAEIVYTSDGKLGKPRGGIVSRILGALWP